MNTKISAVIFSVLSPTPASVRREDGPGFLSVDYQGPGFSFYFKIACAPQHMVLFNK
jgi:hypothetical protein